MSPGPIAIVGVGLMGGSLGLALADGREVVGADPDPEALESALRAAEAPGGWAAALPQARLGDASSHTAEPPAPTMAVEPAALPEADAPPATLLADALPAPASLRGLVRAAIRHEIEGEIDRLVHGPLHRLIRAEVARAVLHMAGMPEGANVQFMTVMATNMPYIGRG